MNDISFLPYFVQESKKGNKPSFMKLKHTKGIENKWILDVFLVTMLIWSLRRLVYGEFLSHVSSNSHKRVAIKDGYQKSSVSSPFPHPQCSSPYYHTHSSLHLFPVELLSSILDFLYMGFATNLWDMAHNLFMRNSILKGNDLNCISQVSLFSLSAWLVVCTHIEI